ALQAEKAMAVAINTKRSLGDRNEELGQREDMVARPSAAPVPVLAGAFLAWDRVVGARARGAADAAAWAARHAAQPSIQHATSGAERPRRASGHEGSRSCTRRRPGRTPMSNTSSQPDVNRSTPSMDPDIVSTTATPATSVWRSATGKPPKTLLWRI